MANEINGRGVSVQWVLGILIIILLAVQGYTIAQVSKIDDRTRETELRVSRFICSIKPDMCLSGR